MIIFTFSVFANPFREPEQVIIDLGVRLTHFIIECDFKFRFIIGYQCHSQLGGTLTRILYFEEQDVTKKLGVNHHEPRRRRQRLLGLRDHDSQIVVFASTVERLKLGHTT